MQRDEFIKRMSEALKRCDFCSGELPLVKVYSAKTPLSGAVPFPEGDVILDDTGDWVACEECAKLIDSDQWKALAERALAPIRAVDPTVSDEFHYRALKIMWSMVFGEGQVKL